MTPHEIFGLLAIVAGVIRYSTYYFSIVRGQSRPHLFTWLTWGLITTLAWWGQVVSGAGAGAWATCLIAIASFGVCLLALKYGEREITRSDWVSFVLALLAIPIWLMTKDPLWAMVWLTAIDATAYWPTYRKTWRKPQTEALFSYGFTVVRQVFSLLALETVSVTTAVYPAAIMILDLGFIGMVLLRRSALSRNSVVSS